MGRGAEKQVGLHDEEEEQEEGGEPSRREGSARMRDFMVHRGEQTQYEVPEDAACLRGRS